VLDPLFVLLLKSFNNGARIIVGSIVNQFMACGAEQNQIVGRVDVVWAFAVHPTRAEFAERDYVSVLRKIAALERKRMLKKIAVATAEFAPGSSVRS
jgi:hypothetical protein